MQWRPEALKKSHKVIRVPALYRKSTKKGIKPASDLYDWINEAGRRATLTAVRADALSYPHDGDFIHAYALARKAVTEREALFRPKRIRKAERKAGEIDRIVRYVSAKPIFLRNLS